MDFLTEICRCCLAVGIETNSFSDEFQYESNLKLSEIYDKVTRIKINIDEANLNSGPMRICHQCTERLLNAFKFILFVEKNEEEYQKWLQISQANQEDSLINCPEKVLENEYNMNVIESNGNDSAILEIFEELVEINEEERLQYETEIVSSVSQVSVDEGINLNTFEEDNSETIKIESKSSIGSRLNNRLSPHHYKCEDCFRTFAKEETLIRHRNNAHTFIVPEKVGTVSNSKAIITTLKKFHCPFCPRDFVRRDYYVRHLIKVHQKHADISPEDQELANRKNNPKGLCPHCGESFSKNSLSVHIRRHTGENPYKCSVCFKSFPRRQDMNIHFRQHTGERPDVCPVCCKSFSRANKLTRHMRIHTGERPYKCSKCPRTFIQSNDLKIHLRRHTGEKPYKCGVCSEGFICGAALRTHRRRKNHHLPNDDMDDPFANWRVSTRNKKNSAFKTIS